MCARQRPAAQRGVDLHALDVESLDLCGALAVPELPNVELTFVYAAKPLAHQPRARQPAEEDVACRLHELLSFDDPPALVTEALVTGIGFEHRRPCLFHLEEEWVLLVPPQQQHDPAPGAYAADPDDLVRSIDVVVAVNQAADIGVHAAAVLLDQALQQRLQVDLDALFLSKLCERDDQWWVADDASGVAVRPGELVELPQAVLPLRLGDSAIELLAPVRGHVRAEVLDRVDV